MDEELQVECQANKAYEAWRARGVMSNGRVLNTPTRTPYTPPEPVFGHTKFNRRIERFQRRGLAACRSEWRLIAATHNLTKLYRHHLAATPA